MRTRLYGSAALATAVLGAAIAGCGTKTTMTDVWTAQGAAGPMHSVLVMAARTDQATRHTLEDALVARLAEHGVRATTSYTLFHDTYPTPEQAHDVVRNVGFDGMLVSTSRGTTERARVVMDGSYFWSDYYYGPSWAGWYPGYVYTDTYVKFDTTLWDERAGGKLVFAALTQTLNPSSGPAFARSLTNSVIPSMVKAGLLPPKGTPERLAVSEASARPSP